MAYAVAGDRVRRGVAEGAEWEQTAAVVAIEAVRRMIAGKGVTPGTWLPEEVMSVDDLFRPLMARGCRIYAEDLREVQARRA